MDSSRKVQLYGGMASIDLPSRMADVSDFRPVPDHQEIHTDANSDQSVMIEILDMVEGTDEESMKVFWSDWCTGNEAMDPAIGHSGPASVPTAITSSNGDATALVILGTMKASKGQQGPEAANEVAVCLGVVRLPRVKTDVLISLCTPTFISENSAAAEDTVLRDRTLCERAPGLFKAVFESFGVHDWSLFGEG